MRTCMMGLEAFSSKVFLDAMYEDMVLSLSACTQPSQPLGIC